MFKLEVQHCVFSVDRKKTNRVIQTENDPLESQVESLLSGLEDGLVKGNHVFNVDRNILSRLLVQAMFVNKVSHSLFIGVRMGWNVNRTTSQTHRPYRLPHLLAHLMLSDPGVVDPKIFPVGVEGARFFVTLLPTAAVGVVLELAAPVQKPVHIIRSGQLQCLFCIFPLQLG